MSSLSRLLTENTEVHTKERSGKLFEIAAFRESYWK